MSLHHTHFIAIPPSLNCHRKLSLKISRQYFMATLERWSHSCTFLCHVYLSRFIPVFHLRNACLCSILKSFYDSLAFNSNLTFLFADYFIMWPPLPSLSVAHLFLSLFSACVIFVTFARLLLVSLSEIRTGRQHALKNEITGENVLYSSVSPQFFYPTCLFNQIYNSK